MKPLLFPKAAIAAALATAFVASASIERPIDRSFDTEPGAKVMVKVSGASINVKVGTTGKVVLHVDQVLKVDTESEAADLLAEYDIVAEMENNVVTFVSKPKNTGFFWTRISNNKLRQKVFVTVPADTELNLDTSGGSITVEGEIAGDVRADTSGGSIRVDGGAGYLNLDTSGGSISVGRALGSLRADTSGGSIRVDYVGPSATDVDCDTSGGSIRVGVDPAGNFDLTADTSGGSVTVEGLPFNAARQKRTEARGRINEGGARLRADTSGGSITISAAKG